MIVLSKPDEQFTLENNPIRIFLAGSIDMGSSEDWQTEIYNRLEELDVEGIIDYNIEVYNPRRNSWDSSWTQEQSNAEFNYQVNWELSNIEESDIIFFNILPDSKSPITLMELGLCAGKEKKSIVCCPDGFYRKGNVDVICTRYGIQQYQDIDSAFGALLTTLNKMERSRTNKN
jgi:nucleoside 2-deoxyribosyltransferase